MYPFLIQPLDPALHERSSFDCGVELLTRYLQEQASQDMKRKACGCWVLVSEDNPEVILGYYTLSPEGVEHEDLPNLPKAISKKLPRYKRLGAVLLGRLAVHKECTGKGLGARLLMDAMHRAYHSEIPSVLMVTDPKDKKAEGFYAKYGFERLNAERFFLTMVRISELLASGD
jgi:predicted GNAT family N-acyltransferase